MYGWLVSSSEAFVDLSQLRLAILGAGNMGQAVLAGALRAGVQASHVWATSVDAAQLAQVKNTYGVQATADNLEAIGQAQVVVCAVKPQHMEALLAQISAALPPQAVVVSVAAGLPLAFFESRLSVGQPVVRVMPNTPAAVGAGVAAASAGTHAGGQHMATVMALLAGTGDVVEVPEGDQAAVGAVSGSGPAYVFYLVDALAEAGVSVGLSRQMATRLAVGTVLGSAQLLAETGEHPAIAREKVSSPGGTTVKALQVLDQAGVRAAFVDAVQAAVARTHELQAELDR